MIRTIIKIAVPVVIMILAVLFFQYQMAHRPQPKKKQAQKIIPIVRTVTAELVEGYRYQVSGYGAVEPAGELTMMSEVGGKIIWVSDKLKLGGRFKKNEWMYRIDDTEYVKAVDSAISSLKSAELELKQVEEEGAISRKEWEIWNDTAGETKRPSELVSYEPQLEAAKAAVAYAKSALVSAQSDLAKVVFKAPFDCVVTEESIEHGKIIRTGESAGTLVRTDWYEVHLPLAAKDAVRMHFSTDVQKASDGYIELAEGKNAWKWKVYAERLLPEADESTGMLMAVLVVPEPLLTSDERPLLPISASVRAVISDTTKQNMVRIPDEALRDGSIVWVLSPESTVQIRDVKIAERRGDYVYVSSGVMEGDKIITSDMTGVLDGMTVNTGKQNMGGQGNAGGAQ